MAPSSRKPLPSRRCERCQRTFEWRKKWARDWENVRYCSDACRTGRHTGDPKWEKAILELLADRSPEASICPSDVARAAAKDWRPLMDPIREAAARLLQRGAIRVTQGERDVDPLNAHGPIRLRRPIVGG